LEKQVNKFINKYKSLFGIATLLFCSSNSSLKAQDSTRYYLPLDYNQPTEYTIVSIETKGNKFIDKNIIIFNSNLSYNQKIKVPGNEISMAIDNLWKQGYFSFVSIYARKIEDKKIYLVIEVGERPRLEKFSLRGIGKAEAKSLREELTIKAGMVINEDMLNRVTR
jgi:outer membrane protein insertion porin family